MTTSPPRPELDPRQLDQMLDRVKTKVFLGKRAAFLAPLMCGLNILWDGTIPTACTDGLEIRINPRWFTLLPEATRMTVLMHELDHVAKLVVLRRGDRDPVLWNQAVDYNTNGELDDQGYSFEGCFPAELFPPHPITGERLRPCLDHQYDGMAAEQIYDALVQLSPYQKERLQRQFQPDIVENPQKPVDPHKLINTVVAAVHSATLNKKAGDIPGEVQQTLKKFLKPKLPWRQLLQQFLTQLLDQDYSWRRPNRRYLSQGAYLPSLMDDDGGLEHLAYYFDTSASVTDPQVVRFNSEVKHIKESFRPQKLTLVQFDRRIQKETVYLEDDPFDCLEVQGRGGTSLVCVREHIIEHRPTAVVVFSDLECAPMEKLPAGLNIPILWVCIDNEHAQVNEGQLIHIKE